MTAPEIRKLPEVIKMKEEKLNIRKVSIGQPDKYYYPGPEKVLMLLGETGTGKSTLINGLVNYIMGVKYEDKFRYKLVDDKTERSQAHSQTKWITAYTFHKQPEIRLPYTFTIVDTPGYGDTEGFERDKEITKQIKEFFSIKGPEGIDQLNGIGFVVKASDCRLTITQKYIFDSILSIFGKDFSQNIFMMVTFADGGDPQVLDAIAEANLAFQDSFKFNNSALLAKSTKKKSMFDSMYWEMGEGSFEDFFKTFNQAKSVSLMWTKEVLEEREHLECIIQGLQKNIQAGLSKADQLHQEEIIMKEHETELLTNKDFTYEVDIQVPYEVKLATGEHVSHCLKCNTTCHYPCYIADNDNKAKCRAMGGTQNCTSCPNKCHWSNHKNIGHRIELRPGKETRTSEELKTRHYEAASKKTAAENVLAGLKKDIKNLNLAVVGMTKEATKILQRLEEIALRPNPLTEIQYIDLLIEAEKREGKPGFQQRIRALHDVREQAKIVSDIKEKSKVKQMLDNAADYCQARLKFKVNFTRFFRMFFN